MTFLRQFETVHLDKGLELRYGEQQLQLGLGHGQLGLLGLVQPGLGEAPEVEPDVLDAGEVEVGDGLQQLVQVVAVHLREDGHGVLTNQR